MSNCILVLNAGSSSLKFAVYPVSPGEPLLRGKIDGLGHAPRFSARDTMGRALEAGALSTIAADSPYEAISERLRDWLKVQLAGSRLAAVGHRVVHGGTKYDKRVRVDETVLEDLERLTPLAPLHEPHNIAAIRAAHRAAPDIPQIACFDTSFHRTQPRLAQLFAIPRALTEQGILRYGFHGLSYEYIASVLPQHLGDRAEGRVIVAHLGNGASLCAMKNRKSVATSMGFTALDGLMMGERCGAIDPGVVLYLQQAMGLSVQEVSDLLYKKSGLLGVSGVSADIRELTASTDPRAAEAIGLFVYRAAREVGALATLLGGLDALVFTAGIGENTAEVRSGIAGYLGWIGVALDQDANQSATARISSAESSVDVLIIPTDEEGVIAKHVREYL